MVPRVSSGWTSLFPGSLFVLAEGALFLRVLYCLLLHVETLASAHDVHVLESLVCGVRLLPKVQVLFFCGGDPVGVAGDHLERKALELDN